MLKYLISERDVCRSDYKDVIHDPYLCDGDSLYVGYPDWFFYSLVKDYEQFADQNTESRLTDRDAKEVLDKSLAQTDRILVTLENGSVWYITILGVRYINGWRITFRKEPA